MVTPSLVIVGPPYFLPSTTLRPFGPRVTLTALARVSTPRSSERRASSEKLRVLLTGCSLPGNDSAPAPSGVRGAVRSGASGLDDGEHVAGGEHEVLLAAVLHLGAAVLAVQD